MILITGATGFLGARLLAAALEGGRNVIAASRTRIPELPGARSVRCDLGQPGAALELIEASAPEWVINCAALASVDECEVRPADARRINAQAPLEIAEACRDTGARLLHVSTDSVFDGARGDNTENDQPRPINVYAATKLEGEGAVLKTLPRAVVVRTNFIGNGSGLADWIVGRLESGHRVTGFTDVIFSPLLVDALAEILLAMVDARLEGVYHASARDKCSKYEIARMLAGALDLDGSLIDEGTLDDAQLTAPRPLDTSLSPARLEAELGPMPTVADAVEGYARLRRARHPSRLDGARAG